MRRRPKQASEASCIGLLFCRSLFVAGSISVMVGRGRNGFEVSAEQDPAKSSIIHAVMKEADGLPIVVTIGVSSRQGSSPEMSV